MTTVVQLSRNSLRDLELMENAVKQIKDYFKKDEKIIVVASSMGDIPNRIEDAVVSGVEMRPEEILKEADEAYEALGDKNLNLCRRGIYELFKCHTMNSNGKKTKIMTTGEELKGPLPLIYVTGEMLSGPLLSYFFYEHNMDAEFVNPQETRIPLVARGEPLSATVDLDDSKAKAKRFSLDKKVTIFPGYCGMDSKGVLRILGHGGSKTAAVAYGYVFDADRVWLCDTEYGIKEAHIEGTKTETVPELSIDEARAIAKFGAYLKTAETLNPLDNGYEPEFCIANSQALSGKKTFIMRNTSYKKPVKIVAGRDLETCSLRTDKNTRLWVEKELDRAGVDYNSSWFRPDLNIIITGRNKDIPYRIIKGFEERGKAKIVKYSRIGDDGSAMVGVIGHDLEGELGIERRGAEAIEDAGVRIKDTLMGGPNAIIYLIERKDRPKSE
ncbi:MAG: hypothetical protein V1900_02345, partial [Candidatus Aenigmatarchaeota archaeon]